MPGAVLLQRSDHAVGNVNVNLTRTIGGADRPTGDDELSQRMEGNQRFPPMTHLPGMGFSECLLHATQSLAEGRKLDGPAKPGLPATLLIKFQVSDSK